MQRGSKENLTGYPVMFFFDARSTPKTSLTYVKSAILLHLVKRHVGHIALDQH